MSFDFDGLRAFVVLAEELHFGRAARRIHLSQPALTKQIQRLESALGGRLFDRTTGGVQLTPAGHTLRERSKTLLTEVAAFEVFAREAVQGGLVRLRIGFGIATLGDLLPKAVISFRKTHPNTALEMQDMGSRAQLQGVLDGSLDLGFVRMPISNPHLESKVVLREEMLIALPSTRFRRPVALADLRDERFVLIARSTSETFQDHALSLCLAAGFAADVVQEAKEMFTVLNLVRAGLGVTLVPGTAQRMRVPGVRFCSVKDPSAAWDVGLIWRKDRRAALQPFVRAVVAASSSSRL